MTAPDPGLTDLIAAHRWTCSRDEDCICGWVGQFADFPAHVALVVEQYTNGRIAELEAAIARVEKLAAEYARDDQEHLNTFGQHHPVAGIAHDHLRAALEGEQQ